MKKMMLVVLAIVALVFFAGCSSGGGSSSGSDDTNSAIPSETVQLFSAKANADGSYRLTLNFGPLWNGAESWEKAVEGGYEPWLAGSKGLLPAACKLTLDVRNQTVYGDFIIADDEDLEIKIVWRHPITKAEILPWLDEKNDKVSAWIFRNQDGWKRLGAVFYANPARFTPLPNGNFLRADIFKFGSLWMKTYLMTCNSEPSNISTVVATVINGKGHGTKNVALDLKNPWTKVLDNLEDGVNLINFRVVFKDGSVKWMDVLGLMDEGIGWAIELSRTNGDKDWMFCLVSKNGEGVRPATVTDGEAIMAVLKANAYFQYSGVGFVGGKTYIPVSSTTTTTTTLSSTTTTSTSTTTTTTTTLAGTTSTTTLQAQQWNNIPLNLSKAIFVTTVDANSVPAGTWNANTGVVVVNYPGNRYDVLLKIPRVNIDPSYLYRFTCDATSLGGARDVTVQFTKATANYDVYAEVIVNSWSGAVSVLLQPIKNDEAGALYFKFGTYAGTYSIKNIKLEYRQK